ncbi:hypothetical protein LQK89_02550 [Curtobacterium sp. C1]|uniref:hypothetical protein n=1 Tax=Curtobacterium sp. C1 TaxID=2898151 RepID=UPI001E59FC28|nr:hypothetical protein [Curtobacterium sp. C1]UFU14598.1 hypothetical protein LQK89_02550 [Curtobacterium sp. C1]
MTLLIPAPPYLERVVVDGSDRAAWEAARRPFWGASDAKTFAKAESIDRYLIAKLAPKSFHGNEYTEQGHRWEPLMLEYAAIPQNVALVRSPHNDAWACTPDGIRVEPTGRLTLAECKVRHGKVYDGPAKAEWRQLAFQFECFPEADEIAFLWVELVRDANGEWQLREGLHGRPRMLAIRRDHPEIVAARATILPIATELATRLRVALSYERSAA